MLRLQVELVHDRGCPNVARARAVLTRALQEAGVPAVWSEWVADDPGCPDHLRTLGSPTVLINGEDVAPGPHRWAPLRSGEAPRTRVYRDTDGRTSEVPPLGRILEAVLRAITPDAG
ncbi:MAG: hypothetical protein ACE5GJ_09995 [Gemmatimonadota bacterium]